MTYNPFLWSLNDNFLFANTYTYLLTITFATILVGLCVFGIASVRNLFLKDPFLQAYCIKITTNI